MKDRIQHYVRHIENALARQDFDANPPELYDPMAYILALGGKRLRPALTLAACELMGGKLEDAMMPALGIEMFHNFSLIHDDIMDEADLRRGKATVHKKWGQSTAILAGDGMLVKAYQLIAQVDPKILPRVLKSFSETALEVCEGQQFDLNFEKQEDVTEDDYLEMITLKTSVLLGCAMRVGGIIGGAKPHNAQLLYDFGKNIGVAFQIQDDILDTFGDPEKFGKTPGGDILNDKKTILFLNAQHNANASQAELLKRNYGSSSEKVETISSVMKETGALNYAEQKMDAYYKEALTALDQVPGEAELKNDLAQFAEWLIKRDR